MQNKTPDFEDHFLCVQLFQIVGNIVIKTTKLFQILVNIVNGMIKKIVKKNPCLLAEWLWAWGCGLVFQMSKLTYKTIQWTFIFFSFFDLSWPSVTRLHI